MACCCCQPCCSGRAASAALPGSSKWCCSGCSPQRCNNAPPEERTALLERSLANALWRQLRPAALARLEWHRQQGHRLVIVSASPRCLLQPIAQRLGVELIATETSDPCSNAPIQLHSANCKGPEKIHRLQAWLNHEPSATPSCMPTATAAATVNCCRVQHIPTGVVSAPAAAPTHQHQAYSAGWHHWPSCCCSRPWPACCSWIPQPKAA